jgi:RimJ/RimL family protein N-acetyltransferase
MKLTLLDIEKDPSILTYEILLKNNEIAILRPLEKTDIEILTKFLENLSKKTRKNYTLDSYDKNTAQEFCNAINRYDKLRFLLIEKTTNDCIGIFEYSLDIPESDETRFANYNIQLNSETDCRMGPCLSDLYQNSGIGSMVFPYLIKIAKNLGQQRMILWGGVFSDNERAISFYEKNGFKRLGSFTNQDNKASLDMIIEIGLNTSSNN